MNSEPRDVAHQGCSFFFIDSCKHYRGPIQLATMRMLYNEEIITRRTYVFAEQISKHREWVRIERLPALLEALHARVPEPRSENMTSQGCCELAPQDSGLFSEVERETAAARPPPPPPQIPFSTSSLDAPQACAPSVVMPRADVMITAEDLSAKAVGNLSDVLLVAKAAAASRIVSTNPERPLPWYKQMFTRKKCNSQMANQPQERTKWSLGQPLDELPLVNGVPEVLVNLRRVLFEQHGQLSEGIFRVSPAATDLSAHLALLEAGRFDELCDVDCVAHLIKRWFKVLPESIFQPQLTHIVDGMVQDGKQCAHVMRLMPEIHRRIIEWLLRLFTDICQHEMENRMTVTSLTIVFSPNLLDPPRSIDPMLVLELNKRVVYFLERLFNYWTENNCCLE